MHRIGNGMILAGLIGLSMIGAPYSWVIIGMGGAFCFGFLFPAIQ